MSIFYPGSSGTQDIGGKYSAGYLTKDFPDVDDEVTLGHDNTSGASCCTLNGLLDVNTDGAQDGDFLEYDADSLTWKPSSVTPGSQAWQQETFTLTPSTISGGVTLSVAPADAYQLFVQVESGTGLMMPIIDYTVTGTTLAFTAPVQAVLASGEDLLVRYLN